MVARQVEDIQHGLVDPKTVQPPSPERSSEQAVGKTAVKKEEGKGRSKAQDSL